MLNPAQIRNALNTAITQWETVITAMGLDSQFTLHSGEQFTIKVIRRKKIDENITEGLQQHGFEIQFLAKHWDQNAPTGRAPEKGDQLIMAGRRHAIESSKLIQYGTARIGFVARVVG